MKKKFKALRLFKFEGEKEFITEDGNVISVYIIWTEYYNNEIISLLRQTGGFKFFDSSEQRPKPDKESNTIWILEYISNDNVLTGDELVVPVEQVKD